MDDCECLSIQERYRYAEGVIVNRVHWLQAKAQFERWKEEQYIIHNEAAVADDSSLRQAKDV
jgi:hypothetical protein